MISVISYSKLQTTVKLTFWSQVARVNFVIGVRFLVDPTQIFYPMNMVGTSVQGKLRMRKQNTKTTVPLDVAPDDDVPDDAPRDFGPEVAFVS